MRMRINEARGDGFSAEIHFLGRSSCKVQYICVTAYGKKSVTRNRHCLRARLLVIHGQYVCVIENEVRLLPFEWKKRKSGKRAKKFAARSSIVHDNPLRDGRRLPRMLRRPRADVKSLRKLHREEKLLCLLLV